MSANPRQTLMFEDESTLSMSLVELASLSKKRGQYRRARTNNSAAGLSSTRTDLEFEQYSFFDASGAINVCEIAEAAQQQVDAALASGAGILGGAQDLQEERSNLEFARFLRSAGIPEPEVAASLHAAGVDADRVMGQLTQVEAVVGADYPEQVLVDLALDPELETAATDFEELDLANGLSEDGHEEASGASKEAAHHADSAVADTALSALITRIAGPRYAPPSKEEEAALARRIQAGDRRAEEELVNRNMRFLVLMAKRFRYTGRPLDEIISAGVMGLLTAVKKFDPTRARFTTCAQHWIRQAIQRGLLHDSPVAAPDYLWTVESKLRQRGAQASSAEERESLLRKADALNAEIQLRKAAPISLDGSPDEESDGVGLHNVLAAEDAGMDNRLETSRLLGWLVRAANTQLKTLDGLPDVRARDVFLMRLGLHPDHHGEQLNFREIAAIFGVSHERVRQIHSEASLEVVFALEHYAGGARNLPEGFCEQILTLGHRRPVTARKDEKWSAVAAPAPRSTPATPTAAPVSARARNIDEILRFEAAGPTEVRRRDQLVSWLVRAAHRELLTEAGRPDELSRDVFLMRMGLHEAHPGVARSVGEIGRDMGLRVDQVREIYVGAVEEIAYAVEHYADGAGNLPEGFREGLLNPPDLSTRRSAGARW